MVMMKPIFNYALLLLCLASGTLHAADLLKVVDPWARATVPGQNVGGVYMELVASENLRLTGIKTAASETAEVHQMKMDNGMMRMRPVPYLALPAGKRVKLEPGGYHVMLFDLKNSLVAGQKFKLELIVQDAAKKQHRVPVEVDIRDRTGPADHEHR